MRRWRNLCNLYRALSSICIFLHCSLWTGESCSFPESSCVLLKYCDGLKHCTIFHSAGWHAVACCLSLHSTACQSALAFKPISSSKEFSHESEVKHCLSALFDWVSVLSVFSDHISNVLASWRALPHALRADAYSCTLGYTGEWYPGTPNFCMNRGNTTPIIFPQVHLLIQQSLIKLQHSFAVVFSKSFLSIIL